MYLNTEIFFKNIFQKPLDKLKNICYNIDTIKQQRGFSYDTVRLFERTQRGL